MFRYWRSFPFRLWELLQNPTLERARQILAVDTCLLDEFSRRFLNRFHSPQKLISAAALGTLAALTAVVRLDIIPIECRSAQIKRLLRVRSSTHAGEFAAVSGDFLLQQQRLLERYFKSPKQEKAEREEERKVNEKLRRRKRRRRVRRKGRFKGSVVGGGGRYRYIISLFLKGKPMRNKSDRKKAFKDANRHYRDLKEAGRQAWAETQQNGHVGTFAYRRSGSAFGGRKRYRLQGAIGDEAPAVRPRFSLPGETHYDAKRIIIMDRDIRSPPIDISVGCPSGGGQEGTGQV